MKVNTDYQKRCSNIYFGIKVSKNFITAAHNHYNYQVGTNKKQNIYRFNNKVKEFEGFGFDNYTLDYERRLKNGNWQHYLVAKKEDSNQKINIIANRDTLLRIINKFLSMDESEFSQNFRKHK